MDTQKIIIRKAYPKDLLSIYKLSNDSLVRKNSFYPGKIELTTHRKWFTQKLNDKNCVFFVAKLNNDLVGQVRYQIDGHEATVSISIDDNYRGGGNGQIILRETLRRLKLERPEISNIIACIKPDNLHSIDFFQKIGFIYKTNITIENHKAVKYLYQI